MTDHNVPLRTRADQAGSRALRMLSGLGLLTLLSAVVFWWGGVVGPQIFALVFPQLLPLDAIPDDLNPDRDGLLANMVSTAAFLVVALLSCVNGAIGHHRKSGWVVVGGWIVLALTLTFLAVEDLAAVILRGGGDSRRGVSGALGAVGKPSYSDISPGDVRIHPRGSTVRRSPCASDAWNCCLVTCIAA